MLSLNECFGFNDSLPAWNDLYRAAGLRGSPLPDVPEGCVSVHFIDVGQGDSALIRTGERDILIDSGESDEYPRLAGYLKDVGVTSLGTVIVTHPHSDHMGGMYRVIGRFGADTLIMPDVPETLIPASGAYTHLFDIAARKNITISAARPGLTADTCSAGTLEVIAPVREYEDLNNFSAVVKYTFGNVSFLFCGDIERDAEADILDAGADISADVIKVPHHGSGTSSSRAFVNAVSPEYAVFCVGAENEHGHPHSNIVRLYEDTGAQIYRTDMDGDVVFVTDGRSIEVFTGKDRLNDAA